jgi:hypothetical protein
MRSGMTPNEERHMKMDMDQLIEEATGDKPENKMAATMRDAYDACERIGKASGMTQFQVMTFLVSTLAARAVRKAEDGLEREALVMMGQMFIKLGSNVDSVIEQAREAQAIIRLRTN